MENYYYFKEMGGRMMMKKNVVSWFFSCQSERTPTKERAVLTKLKHIEILKQVSTAEPGPSNVPDPSIHLPKAVSNTESEEHLPLTHQREEDFPTKLDKAVQVKPKFRSVGTSCHLKTPAGINAST
jgi:hypothetical protein